MGISYNSITFTPRRLKAAFHNLRKASSQGHDKAEEFLEELLALSEEIERQEEIRKRN